MLKRFHPIGVSSSHRYLTHHVTFLLRHCKQYFKHPVFFSPRQIDMFVIDAKTFHLRREAFKENEE